MASKYRIESEDRAIIQGFWSDLMDVFRASFEDGGGENVSLKVSSQGEVSLESNVSVSIEDNLRINTMILDELKLLNARFEEAFNTGIDGGDI